MTPRIYSHPDRAELSLPRVLAALSDPIRLEMIRRLADGEEHDSLGLADDLPRSTLTYHTRILRESGVTWTRGAGRSCLIRLRREDLDAAFPGVLTAVIDSVTAGKDGSNPENDGSASADEGSGSADEGMTAGDGERGAQS